MVPARSLPGVCSLLVTLLLVAAAAGDDPPRKRPPTSQGPPASRREGRRGLELPGPFRLPPHVPLTPEQHRALEEIYRELGPRWRELEDGLKALMTEELRAAERAAREEARRQGLRGPQEREFIEASLPLTPEQRAVRNDLQEAREQLDHEITARIRELLTPEQLSAAGPRFRAKGKPPVPPGAPGAPPVRQGPPALPHPAGNDGRNLPPGTLEDRRSP